MSSKGTEQSNWKFLKALGALVALTFLLAPAFAVVTTDFTNYNPIEINNTASTYRNSSMELIRLNLTAETRRVYKPGEFKETEIVDIAREYGVLPKRKR